MSDIRIYGDFYVGQRLTLSSTTTLSPSSSTTTSTSSTTSTSTSTTSTTTLSYVGSYPSIGDEFNGVMSDWTDFRTAYSVSGTNVDITAKLQQALDDLGGTSPVLYIGSNNGQPTTYLISDTVTWTGRTELSIIGEDPSLVTFKWVGSPDATAVMFDVNGAAYSKIFQRCTLDGNNNDVTLIYQGYDGQNGVSGKVFDTGNEYADTIFMNARYGIKGGFSGNGFAETSIMRCRFYNMSCRTDTSGIGVGIVTGNFNALDCWIWNSHFENCDIGISNWAVEGGSGNWHTFGCTFKNNIKDMEAQATEQFSVRECVSSGSEGFLHSGFNRPNVSNYVLAKNRIIGVFKPSPYNQWADFYSDNNAAAVFLDNTHYMHRHPTNAESVYEGAFMYGGASITITALGDKTNYSHPYIMNMAEDAGYVDDHVERYAETVVADSAIDTSLPSLYPLQPKITRQVFTASPSMTQGQLQALLDSAVLQSGSRPLVYFPKGTYNFISLNIPSSDLQLMGITHGYTQLTGTLNITGPSKVTIRNMMFSGSNSGIIINNVNQAGSRIYAHELEAYFNSTKCIEISNVDIPVYFVNSGVAYGSATGVKLSGGQGTTHFIAAQGMQNATHFDVTNAKLYVGPYWAEKSSTETWCHLKGGSTVTLAGGRIATPHNILTYTLTGGSGYTDGTYSNVVMTGGLGSGSFAQIVVSGGLVTSVTLGNNQFYNVGDSISASGLGSGAGFHITVNTITPPIVKVEGQNNIFTMFGYNISNYVEVTGDSTGSKMLLTENLLSAPYIKNTATGSPDVRILQNLYRDGSITGSLGADIGVRDENFVTTLMAHARSVSIPKLLPNVDGLTDIRLFSVRLQSTGNGLQIIGPSL